MPATEADLTALHAAILRSPDDDVLRGAYADALDELASDASDGQATRAELIRVQLDLHPIEAEIKGLTKSGVWPGDRESVTRRQRVFRLRARQAELLRADPALYRLLDCPPDRGWAAGARVRKIYGRDAWHGCWMLGRWRDVVCLNFVRGLVGEAATTVRSWCQVADELLARHPVTDVTVYPVLPGSVTPLVLLPTTESHVVTALSDGDYASARWALGRWPSVRRWHFPGSRDES